MKYEVKKLVAKEDRIFTIDGEYIASLSMTQRAKALLDNDGWDRKKESWIDYRNRTEQERVEEDLKRNAMACDIVAAYNDLMQCD